MVELGWLRTLLGRLRTLFLGRRIVPPNLSKEIVITIHGVNPDRKWQERVARVLAPHFNCKTFKYYGYVPRACSGCRKHRDVPHNFRHKRLLNFRVCRKLDCCGDPFGSSRPPISCVKRFCRISEARAPHKIAMRSQCSQRRCIALREHCWVSDPWRTTPSIRSDLVFGSDTLEIVE